MQDDVRALRAYVAEHLGDELVEWPGGRPGEVEVALVDAVMSIRARYGRPGLAPTGVHRAVAAYRRLRGEGMLDDLGALAAIDPADMGRAVGSQRTGGELKAEAIVRAAAALAAVGVVRADDVQPGDERQKRAYTSVRGLGWVTWEYFGMLLGRPGVKADRWVIRAVSNAVRRPVVTATEAKDVVLATARDTGESPTRLEHALWAFERSREQV
ncbi:hypothetical protein JOD57_004163 [Geodermatophilus bullaregiensis]|uniref:hypothetical protein n=1 Tax=Geodermatophilus bullaregiensis TaxID=1564160 RepID=UPI0019571EF2|nr:hypothetical protein [Geodermatophilus bullaregiensis]MBM7808326.1 hypothetical protein [Geodermatophilus bullaregiensis]